jgi:hypothetical protein
MTSWIAIRALGKELGEQVTALSRPMTCKVKFKKPNIRVVTLTEWEETIPGAQETEESDKPIMVKRLKGK